jgi:hypothetical protein
VLKLTAHEKAAIASYEHRQRAEVISTAILLAAVYGKSLKEAQSFVTKEQWGCRYPALYAPAGRIVGLVSLYEPEHWYTPAWNKEGFKPVVGGWKLVAKGEGYSHAVLNNE